MVAQPNPCLVRESLYQEILHATLLLIELNNLDSEAVSGVNDRPVVDRTGLSGRFDFVIEYDRDPENTGFPPKAGGPGLVEALRKQLGLRLQATKAPVDVLVIDSIQRPTEN